ncbi:uncharacterized protein LOC133931295 [Phragmites australis]|uniref:uncharacterized protein LOC133931295 n=1 Tax=Phragmites australis TaxID=29695 RepID=UPI002D764D1E|nr:uncharacterized protein LOC133931295 [Phragmites australis]
MRIRKRPQPSSQQASDPSTSTAPQTPQNAGRHREWLEGGEEEGTLHASVDLGQKSGVARRLALPQDNAADCGTILGPQHGADDIQRRCSVLNGHHSPDQKGSVTCTGAVGSKSESPPAVGKVEEHVGNGVLLPVAPVVAVKDEEKVSNGSGGGSKKRRGPAVLMEGSRCSRVNGRGWRCSQPTPVGYSLCEHHLGKGRMRSAAAAARGGVVQLGRTEHRASIPAAAPKAEGPSLPRC